MNPKVASDKCDLLKQVLKKLDKDYICLPLKKELIEINGNFDEALQQNFKHYIVVGFVKKFLDCQKMTKEQEISHNPFYLNLIKKYVSSESKHGTELFGINDDFVNKILNSTQKSQLEKEEIQKFVVNCIEEFCVNITKHTGYAQRYRNNWKREFNECIEDLTNESNRLALADFEVVSDKAEINNLLANYYSDLTQGVYMLKNLVFLNEKKLEYFSLLQEMYLERCPTLAIKIKRFESIILKNTYPQSTILALKIICEQLDKQKEELKYSINKINSELHAYSILGAQYEASVKEYTDLAKQIQEQQWAIDSLKSKMTNSECRTESIPQTASAANLNT